MVVEIKEENIELISKLENEFPTFFSSNGAIIADIKKNVFSKYFIYLEKSNIIGFVNYYDLIDRFEIANIFVLEEYREKKVGSKMIKHLIELGETKKIRNITLEVREDNFPAIELYKKNEFEPVAIRKNYYNGIDGLLMERKMM